MTATGLEIEPGAAGLTATASQPGVGRGGPATENPAAPAMRFASFWQRWQSALASQSDGSIPEVSGDAMKPQTSIATSARPLAADARGTTAVPGSLSDDASLETAGTLEKKSHTINPSSARRAAAKAASQRGPAAELLRTPQTAMAQTAAEAAPAPMAAPVPQPSNPALALRPWQASGDLPSAADLTQGSAEVGSARGATGEGPGGRTATPAAIAARESARAPAADARTGLIEPSASSQTSGAVDEPLLAKSDEAFLSPGIQASRSEALAASGHAEIPLASGAAGETAAGVVASSDNSSPSAGNPMPEISAARLAAAPTATRVESAMGSRSSAGVAMRRTRGSDSADAGSVVHGTPASPSPLLADGGMAGRNQVAVRAGLEGSFGGGATEATAGSNSRDTFAALDAQPGAPTWTHAGAQRAEAGFEDPALGWVSVRADLNAGGVHASVVPGTAEAAQVLGSHMAGLNTHLAEQRIPVETLTMGASTDGGAGAMQQGTGQGHQQGATQNDSYDSPAGRAAVTESRDTFMATRGSAPVAPAALGTGTHISVVA